MLSQVVEIHYTPACEIFALDYTVIVCMHGVVINWVISLFELLELIL